MTPRRRWVFRRAEDSGEMVGWTPPRRREQLRDAFASFLMTLVAIGLWWGVAWLWSS